MKIKNNTRPSVRKRFIAFAFIAIMLLDVIVPTIAMAITGHDNMPEYRSFEPVTTTNMVNLFNGDFTYNIPLMEVPGGYPLNLSYHSSDVNNEALSTWVGMGWNINPGAINRMKKGFPDEFNDKSVTYYNRMPKNWTVGVNAGIGTELFTGEPVSLGLGSGIRYNNYNGLGTSISSSFSVAGVLNLSGSMNNGVFGFDAEIRPGNILNAVLKQISAVKEKKSGEDDLKMKTLLDEEGNFDEKKAKEYIKLKESSKKKQSKQLLSSLKGSSFAPVMRSPRAYPVATSPYTGAMVELQFDVGINFLPVPVDLEVSLGGSFTIQGNNDEEMNRNVYGYLFSENAYSNKEALMDYSTENENTFEKRDNVVGYPLPNNDQYSLSGEAMGGAFRAYRNDVGHYRKDETVSEDFQVNAGADVNVASIATVPPLVSNLVYTGGVELGGSYHKSTTGPWEGKDNEYENFQFRSSVDFPNSGEKYFWRFNQDKSGFFDNSIEGDYTNSNVLRSQLSGGDFELPWQAGEDNYKDFNERHQDKRNKRSTYILQHLNSDFLAVNNEGLKYKVYERNTKVIDWSTYNSGGSNYLLNYSHTLGGNESTGEFVTYNNDGVAYVYGLPVFARNEKQLQYDFPGGEGLEAPLSNPPLPKEMIVRELASSNNKNDSDYKRKIGLANDNEFATTHLLTQILSPDYLDRTGDGPTSDDFGTYTKFNYYRVAGGNDWYEYRTPYTGVNMSYGSLSSRADDMGSYDYGEKEIYFLHSVVSKTHVAIFTLDERYDGQGAKLNSNSSPEDLLKGTDASASRNELKKLKRIDLYSIKDCNPASGVDDIGVWEPKPNAVPLKTVHFEYSYEIGNDVPNSNYHSTKNPNKGKLALKKVYFEYGGAVKAKISPYVFDYEYFTPPSSSSNPYNNSIYGDLEAAFYGNIPASSQLPDYSPLNTDRWGNYRDFETMQNGAGSHNIGQIARFWPYVHQNPDMNYFDPAAYCLKKISLPSGGEIHVQYEQNDYSYVQDKEALMMIPLKNVSGSQDEEESGAAAENKKYYLDIEKMGIDYPYINANWTANEKAELAEQLFKPMINGKRMFFSFLYALIGDDPDPDYTHSDYVEGYARINGYGWDNDGFYFTFKGGSSLPNFQTISYSGGATSKREFPNKVCKEFYKSQRRLKIDGGSNSQTLESAVENDDAEAVANAFVNIMDRVLDGLSGKCKMMEPSMSYVRMRVPFGSYRDVSTSPRYYSKLGGGVRVKRLISYDPGIDAAYSSTGTDNGVIYGKEYSYTKLLDPLDPTSVISSGVATNEPSVGRRESALVNPIDKNSQSKANAFFYGRDMYSLEGPLGESVLPGASIGYSKVTVKPIYNGSNGLGFEEHEFYTVKDFPFQAEKTIVQQANKVPISLSASFFGISLSYERDQPDLAQGYHFINYSMHGKPKSIKKFGFGMENSPYYIEAYEYHKLDDIIKLMGTDLQISTAKMKDLGRESEVLFESRRVYDWGISAKVGTDASGGVFIIPLPPFVIPFVLPLTLNLNGGASETLFDTHVTTQLTTYPSLLKRSVRVQEGIAHYVENLIYDNNTGDPVVTRSYDEFYNSNDPFVDPDNTGVYVDQQFKGAWKYKNLGSKFYNEALYVAGSITYGSSGTSNSLKEFLQFTSSSSSSCADLANFVRGDYIEIDHGGSDVSLYHIDKVSFAENRIYLKRSRLCDGPPTGTISGVEIVRSGYQNRLNDNIGQLQLFKRGSDPEIVEWVDNLDDDHPLIAGLNGNSTLQSLTPGGTANISINVNVSSPNYAGLNLSAYSNQILAQCSNANPSKLEVTNVKFYVEYLASGELKLTILGFTILCNGDPIQINCP